MFGFLLMKTYFAIDLKSFYASVECRERGLDPLTTNLVVADDSRSSKTICLAITPPMKKYGLSGRSRLFEVEQKAREPMDYEWMLSNLFSYTKTYILFFVKRNYEYCLCLRQTRLPPCSHHRIYAD